MTKVEKVQEYITNMYEDDMRWLHNRYCEDINCIDDWIYDMAEFDEMCEGMTPTDIASKVWNGDFNPNHDFWKFDGYANFETSNWASDWVYPEEMAEYIVENDEDFYDDDIREILDEDEEDED